MLGPFKNNQDFYDYVDATIDSLRSNGFSPEADRLHFLLHKVAWNFVSELCAELGVALLTVAEKPLPASVDARVQTCVAVVENVWPDVRRWHELQRQADRRKPAAEVARPASRP